MRNRILQMPDAAEGTIDPHARRHEIEAEIKAAVEEAANYAGLLLPQYAPLIAIGRVAAKALPDLYEDVVKMIEKETVTDEEIATTAAKVSDLTNPERFFADPPAPLAAAANPSPSPAGPSAPEPPAPTAAQ